MVLTTTQLRNDVNSASVMPLAWFPNARFVNTCPIYATNTVTNDISISLANSAAKVEAVSGVTAPLEEIFLPH